METSTCVSELSIAESRAIVGLSESLILELLATKIAELPDLSKKILAVRYHGNWSFEELATCLNLPEATIREAHDELVDRLREYVLSVRTPAVVSVNPEPAVTLDSLNLDSAAAAC